MAKNILAIAVISILVKNRESNAIKVQKILSENAKLIIARMGINPARNCVSNCTGLITIILEGNKADIKLVAKKLNDLYGIEAKANFFNI